jgi:hypothetical protein
MEAQQYLKCEKATRIMLKKKLLTFSLVFIFLLTLFALNINMVTAIDITSRNDIDLTNNLTTTLFYSVAYTPTNYDDVLNQPYESYILYSSNINDWNIANPQNQVRDCNFSVYYSSYRSQLLHQGNLSAPDQILLYNADFIGNYPSNKYFVRLNPKDVYTTQMTCTFLNSQSRTIDIPVTISIVTPTWECQACQYYQWTQDQIKLTVASTLSGYTSKNVGYIASLFRMFYEIAIYAFWVALILLLLLSVSLIFYGIYWVYSYFMKQARQL